MMAMLGRCPKCRQITDDWDGKTTKIKGINNVYKVDNLLCDDCGDLGKGVMFTFLAGLLNTKEIDNVTKQYEKLYKEFLNEKLKENKMSISIRRNAEGKVTTGKSTFKVPKNRSFLSILGNNPSAHGDEFREDGWIYNNGKKTRKWFISLIYGWPKRLWEPKLNDLKTLEEKHHQIHSKLDEFWKDEYDKAWKNLADVKEAHAKPTHKFKASDKKDWWLYKVHHHSAYYKKEYEYSIGWDWVHKPEKPINIEIGQRYYEISQKNMRWCKYIGLFRSSLEEAIMRFLQKNAEPEENKLIDLMINGRRYIYVCVLTSSGSLIFKKESWPRDKYEQIIL